ncbi:alkaline phosphatase PhoX [Nonomuraea sp. LPB2021202275-12-8]|uniref:alkaline phosphatase PhoX n=1 Tax=Nonomuraea sp. LPB2021202275-12-8 TaxID=3120159 RepID=UPI00300D6CB8
MSRKTLLRAGPLWQGGVSPYGLIEDPGAGGLALPAGFGGRVVARSGRKVAGLTWHAAPDGGACFPDGTGWIYVSNSALPLVGGASALRFRADGSIGDAYRILSGTELNRAGGATPWHTWLSCELGHRGRVFECDPYGTRAARPRLAMGRFKHEAAACDPDRQVVYLTEGERDGCFYRFRPGDWGDLTEGALEVLCASGGWEPVPSPAALLKGTRHQVRGARRFDGGDACHYTGGVCFFTTRGDGVLWAYDARTSALERVCDGVLAITSAPSGDLYVATREARVDVITPERAVAPFLRLDRPSGAELTGLAFAPGGGRLYFSARRGRTGGETFEVAGPFRGAWAR